MRIHRFKTPISKWVYDGNCGKLLEVKDDVYNELEQIEEQEINFENSEDRSHEIDELYSKGYFHNTDIAKIEHGQTEIMPMLLSRGLRRITLQLTQQCNLRCSYCIYSESNYTRQRTHSDRKMDFSTAKKAIDFLVDRAIDSDSIGISLYGGEPLLEFELIKKIVGYAKNRAAGKICTFSMTTNGTLLTDEILEFLAENSVNLLISMDGPKEIHDANRKYRNSGVGSYTTIERNLLHIKDKYPDYISYISINMVIDPRDNKLEEIMTFCDYMENVFKISVNASMLSSDYGETKIKAPEEFICRWEYGVFLAYMEEFNKIKDKKHVPQMFRNVVNSAKRIVMKTEQGASAISNKCAPGGPCVPGQSRLFITTEGKLFPCERVSELSETMLIGTLQDGFYYEKLYDILNVAQITSDQCKKCWAFTLCNQCAKMCDMGQSFSATMRLEECTKTKGVARADLLGAALINDVINNYQWSVKSHEA